jgi:hypothetical protein
MATRLVFCSSAVQLVSTSGSVVTKTYAMNGMYNVDGLSNRPRYFSTLLGPDGTPAPYNSYRVKSSTIKITVLSLGPDSLNSQAGLVSINGVNGVTTPPSTQVQMMEMSNGAYKPIGYESTPIGSVTMRQTRDVAQVLGLSDVQFGGGTAAAYNANPTNQALWYVNVAPQSSLVSTASWTMMVEISYDCVLYTLNNVNT